MDISSERKLADASLIKTPEERAVSGYPPRRRYKYEFFPPEARNVQETIDIHCHAHGGGQDALALAKFASHSGMGGLLFKSITDWKHPVDAVNNLRTELEDWAKKEGLRPTQVWAGALIATDNEPPDVRWCEEQIDAGAVALWLPVFNHANTFYKVGGLEVWFGNSDAEPGAHSDPLPWEEARRYGQYLLADDGRLKPSVVDIMRLCKERDVALSFGHATHKEHDRLIDAVDKLQFKKAFIDHPFSPFVDLDMERMRRAAAADITMNLTYNELSPLLGIDPSVMFEAIREVGAEHFTVSSDAGDPLFPNSVECIRLICAYLEAFGLTREELRKVSIENPARLIGVDVSAPS